MKPLCIFGTHSDAGKSSVTMALCRLFAQQGLRVAPFKAQNVSNNAAVTRDGREIARAQCLQAEAAGVEPDALFNPVLLKSQGTQGVQVIVNGTVYQNQTVAGYYSQIATLQAEVKNAFELLLSRYDLVIAEGAGSPVELNLLDRDLSNTFIAQTFQTRNILVADIERGGVFASIYGTLELLAPELRQNLIGVIVNKFRGDRAFFEDGIRIIEQRFGLPVLGVLPYMPLNIDLEDSQSLGNYQQNAQDIKIKVGVIAYPGLSNYNDLDPLMADHEIWVEWIRGLRPLDEFDVIILPGSKTVFRDLQWLRDNQLFEKLLAFKGALFGLCGGYQMLCTQLHDPEGIEHDEPISAVGFKLIDDEVHYAQPKILQRGNYVLFGFNDLAGYEIHCGRLSNYPLYFQNGRISGTHVHGIFDNDNFRTAYFREINSSYIGYDYPGYREQQIQDFSNRVGSNLQVDRIKNALAASD